MNYIKVDPHNFRHIIALYEMLKERTPEESISHKEMPTMNEHTKFVKSNPYKMWFIIESNFISMGNCYISKRNEMGVFILTEFRRNGFGTDAIKYLCTKVAHPFANVNPNNTKAIEMLSKLGFKHIQNTYGI